MSASYPSTSETSIFITPAIGRHRFVAGLDRSPKKSILKRPHSYGPSSQSATFGSGIPRYRGRPNSESIVDFPESISPRSQKLTVGFSEKNTVAIFGDTSDDNTTENESDHKFISKIPVPVKIVQQLIQETLDARGEAFRKTEQLENFTKLKKQNLVDADMNTDPIQNPTQNQQLQPMIIASGAPSPNPGESEEENKSIQIALTQEAMNQLHAYQNEAIVWRTKAAQLELIVKDHLSKATLKEAALLNELEIQKAETEKIREYCHKLEASALADSIIEGDKAGMLRSMDSGHSLLVSPGSVALVLAGECQSPACAERTRLLNEENKQIIEAIQKSKDEAVFEVQKLKKEIEKIKMKNTLKKAELEQRLTSSIDHVTTLKDKLDPPKRDAQCDAKPKMTSKYISCKPNVKDKESQIEKGDLFDEVEEKLKLTQAELQTTRRQVQVLQKKLFETSGDIVGVPPTARDSFSKTNKVNISKLEKEMELEEFNMEDLKENLIQLESRNSELISKLRKLEFEQQEQRILEKERIQQIASEFDNKFKEIEKEEKLQRSASFPTFLITSPDSDSEAEMNIMSDTEEKSYVQVDEIQREVNRLRKETTQYQMESTDLKTQLTIIQGELALSRAQERLVSEKMKNKGRKRSLSLNEEFSGEGSRRFSLPTTDNETIEEIFPESKIEKKSEIRLNTEMDQLKQKITNLEKKLEEKELEIRRKSSKQSLSKSDEQIEAQSTKEEILSKELELYEKKIREIEQEKQEMYLVMFKKGQQAAKHNFEEEKKIDEMTEDKIVLKFLHDAFYYYLKNKGNTREHLNAIMTMLNFTSAQKDEVFHRRGNSH
ncbi:hypothetical protein FO519_005850 [Halicephalobus sp. NKZ332]|nr:hypothetical protein FO519_005850 [Halicephalobus sp. NKZ332]